MLFASVTLGGLGTTWGALVGAIIIGLAMDVSTMWIPTSLKYVVAMLIMIVVLLVRPQGLLGSKQRIG
jgi:branched-chain amino acid transport system permease protein